jgi:NAD(P)-dependent dehydrogenase (short-subunit alcohol dehydrogenase family)
MSSLFDLTGKVAVVTGSTKGIGLAIATRMAEHGATVVISSRKLDACETVAAGIREKGGKAVVIPCHVGRKEELQSLVNQTVARCGGIDILVENAGVNPYLGPAAGMSDDAYDRVMNTNVRSNWWLANMAIPHIVSRGGGAVIIISSKAADIQLARNIAVEWGPKNVRANAIVPGLVRTDFARALWEDPVLYRKRTKDTPLQRIGEPDEIAGAAVFLASAAGNFVTGQSIVIDGGTTAGSVISPDG